MKRGDGRKVVFEAHIDLELTAVLDNRGAIERLAGEVGSDRLLFGTDLPWFSPHQGIGALLSAAISDEDRHNILHRNAARLLGEHPDFDWKPMGQIDAKA